MLLPKDPGWDRAVVNILAAVFVTDDRVDLSMPVMVVVRVAISVGLEIAMVVVLPVSYSVELMSNVLVGVSAGITMGVDALNDLNLNIVAAVITSWDFVAIARSKFNCWAAFRCFFMAVLNCARVLHASMPSSHV